MNKLLLPVVTPTDVYEIWYKILMEKYFFLRKYKRNLKFYLQSHIDEMINLPAISYILIQFTLELPVEEII